MKKIVMFLLLICMMTATLPGKACAEEIANGSCGDTVQWVLTSSGTLTISGTGEMVDYDITASDWQALNETTPITSIVIEEGVTAIGSYAFRMLRNVTDVFLPDGLVAIGDYAFNQCHALVNITLPESVNSIGKGAFDACWSLVTLRIPKGVTEIRDYAFARSGLKSMELHDGIRSIGAGAFAQCAYLPRITIPAGVSHIGEYAFGDSGLDEIRFTGNAPSIGKAPFGYVLNDYIDGTITATAYYPAENATWRDDVRAAFGGNITWLAERNGDNPFTDVPAGQWYTDAVLWAAENGVTTGVAETTFAPMASCSRSQFVTLLWRLEGKPVVNYLMPFDDVAADSWYTEAVRWAASEGIVEGYINASFGPHDPITREQLATILYRYEQNKGGGFKGMWMFPLDYADTSDISDWAYEPMCWMTMHGVINGNGNNMLDPKGLAVRAEAAQVLKKYLDK